jgi:NitT/TauT family transport system ATP-binding protein/sulfonate transport system ATP-binding protein
MDKARQLTIKHLTKEFVNEEETTRVLDDVSLEVFENEFVVILGPGRCGKTTLLNIIAGISKQTDGEVVFRQNGNKHKRPEIGMVYQRISLMPWLTVQKNVEFIMKIKGVPENERKATARIYIEMVKLDGFEKLLPHQLSGGMKQRVGIARAYSTKPDILLMDEPYGQLDAQTRYSMQEEISRIHEQDKSTIVFVTSNLEEALVLGDRIILLSAPPTKVKDVYEINLPHPRDMMDLDFMKLRQEISDNMDLII